MNEFNKGVNYVKTLLKNRLSAIDDEPLIRFVLSELDKIPYKCDFCVKPCGNEWCSTKEENEL